MKGEMNSLNSVGFRQVVEDALAIIDGKELPRERRDFVLRDLSEVVSEAKRCSDEESGKGWFLANANHEAYELFSLLESSLERQGKPWRAWLDSAAATLEGLAKGTSSQPEGQRQSAVLLLKAVLSCVSNLPKLAATEEVRPGTRLSRA